MHQALPCDGYAEALGLLLERIDYERSTSLGYGEREFKLDRMRELLARLGHPERRLPTVHITGTKGKGSTAAMVAAMLTAAGYRTGLFSSPHLECIEERLAIDGQPCPAERFVQLIERLRPTVEAMDEAARRAGPPEMGPTYFELTTALAWMHFTDRQANGDKAVDAVVLEVGMGGRLDSTNVCHPAVTAITSISFDHTKQLGNTLAAIAGEKAGIIKPGVPVVSGVTGDEARDVIRRVSREHDAPLVELGVDFDFRYFPPRDLQHQRALPRIDYRERTGQRHSQFSGVDLGLLGRHQAANAAVALAIVGRLVESGWAISESVMRQGLAAVRLPARVELLSQQPAVIVDGAHNVASVSALLATLDESFRVAGRKVLIFATTKDKDARGMLELLVPRFDQVIVTRYESNPRGVPVDELIAVAQEVGARDVQSVATPGDAWELVSRRSGSDGLICVTGSFFTAAEMRRAILEPTRNSLNPVTS
ncbi:MAG TPA: folylpolyglutamate synthase/dihydrofolate synthase family protein [Pirellulales bacterium]|nr:folylpolyglutamate synthase/dihydrofolate synthase family protein [Pirellulales bacterium]